MSGYPSKWEEAKGRLVTVKLAYILCFWQKEVDSLKQSFCMIMGNANGVWENNSNGRDV